MQKDAVWRAVPSKICHRSLGRCSREQQPELSMFNALTTADTAMASSKDAGSKLKKPSSEQPTLPCCLSISGNKRPIWTMGREKKKTVQGLYLQHIKSHIHSKISYCLTKHKDLQ